MSPSELYGDPEKYFAGHDETKKVEAHRTIAKEAVRRSGRSNPTVLDVGCGRGEFLRAALLEGFTDVVGLELSTEIANYAAGFPAVHVVRETVEQFASHTQRTFDVIMLSAIIEHVHDPNAMIEALSRLTHRGAIVYIDAPCEPNLLTSIGNRLNGVRGGESVYNLAPTFPPYHVFGFNPKALRVLLAKHRFALESINIRAGVRVPARSQLTDRLRAMAATQVNRIANVLRMAGNMDGWARRL